MKWAVPIREEDRFIASPTGSKYHVISRRGIFEGMAVTVRCGRKIRVATYEGTERRVTPAHVCADCIEQTRTEES